MSQSQPANSPPGSTTRRKRKRRPSTAQKNARRVMRQTAERALTVLDVALNIAAGSASDTGVPALSSALAALREVVRKIQTMKTNIEGVDTLERRVAELKDLVEKCCLRPRGHQLEDVQQRIDALCASLSKAAEEAQGIKARGIIKRFFTSNSDAKKLEGLVEDINRAVRDFVTKTVLIIDQNVRAIKTHLEMSFLSTYAKHAQYDSNIVRRGCLEGTREDVLKDAYDWIEASSKEAEKALKAAKEELTMVVGRPGHFLWISGLAGTGKTTIAYSLAEKCTKDDILAANFFCSRSDAECSDPNNIFVTIARQLCQFYAPYKEKVAAALAKNPDIATAGPLRQFQKLILEPLRELKGVFPVCVVIIDALDECRDGGVTSIILNILARHIEELAPFLFIVTSRPEPHITAVFERAHEESLKNSTMPLVLHNVHLKSVLDDIRRYLADGFSKIGKAFLVDEGWPSNQDINTLAELSQGLFIFATTALRFIGDTFFGNPQYQLRRLLAASAMIMYDLYLEVLNAAFGGALGPDSANPPLRRVLGAIALAEEPLSTSGLAGLLGLSDNEIRNTLGGLRSVLHVPEGSDEAVRFVHPTFPEFLLDPSVVKPEAFRIISAEHHLILFTRSLMAMEGLKRNIVGIEKPATFSSEMPGLSDTVKNCIPVHVAYASRFWSVHLSRCGSDALGQDICDLLNRFLTRQMLYWLEACSLLRVLDGALAALETAGRACQTLGASYASAVPLLADCHRFLWTYYYCIDTAPVQVYHSALAVAPTESLVRKAYARELPGSLIVRNGALSHWPPRRDAFTGHDGKAVLSVAFSQGGDYFITGGKDCKAKMWKTSTRTMVQSFVGHTDDIMCVAFSPDGVHLASASNGPDVYVWLAMPGECIRTLKGHTGAVNCVAYSADGRYLLSAAQLGEVKLWDMSDGRCVLTLASIYGFIWQAGISSNGGVIVRGGGASLSLHDVSSTTDETLDFPGEVQVCTFSPDDRFVAARSEHLIRVWRRADKSLVQSVDVPEVLTSRLAFSRDGARIACGSRNGSVYLWQVASQDPPLAIPGHTDSVWDVSWSPDGFQIASVSLDGTVRVCDATQPAAEAEDPTVSRPHPHPHPRPQPQPPLSLPPQLALAHYNGSTVLVHLPSAEVGVAHVTVAAAMPADAPALTLFADVLDAWDAALHVAEDLSNVTRRSAWAVITGQRHIDFSATLDATQPIRISPDGTLLAYRSLTSDNVVDVCDLRTGKVVASLAGHTNYVFTIAFSPDSTLIATGGCDHSARVWNATTGDALHSHEKHTNCVRALVFSSDSHLVASGSYDNSVHVFEAATGRVERVFDNHRDLVVEVAFATHNKRVLALDCENWVYIWDMATGTRLYEVSAAAWALSLTLSPDGASILIGGDNLQPLPLPSSRTWPVYAVSEDGWVYARSPTCTARLCWLPPEWRNLLSSDGANFCCLDRGRRTAVRLDVSHLVEYARTWGFGV